MLNAIPPQDIEFSKSGPENPIMSLQPESLLEKPSERVRSKGLQLYNRRHAADSLQTSQLKILVNVPVCDDFAGLIKYTYFDFCQAIDYINQGVYVTRAETEAAYTELLSQLYRNLEGDKYHEQAFALNRAIYGMAGGAESDLEKYWNTKAYECKKPPELANQSMMNELAKSTLGDPQDLNLDISDVSRLNIPQCAIPEQEMSGLPKAAKKVLRLNLMAQTNLNDADRESKFLALRSMSMANVKKSSVESGGLKIYRDDQDKTISKALRGR